MRVKQYSQSKKRGCPTCDGVDSKSCLRCRGKARLCDWYETDQGIIHIQTTIDIKRRESE